MVHLCILQLCLHSLLSITCNFQLKMKVTHLRKTCRISSICSTDRRKETFYYLIYILHLKWLLHHHGANSQSKLSRPLLKGNTSVKCQISHQRAKITFCTSLSRRGSLRSQHGFQKQGSGEAENCFWNFLCISMSSLFNVKFPPLREAKHLNHRSTYRN